MRNQSPFTALLMCLHFLCYPETAVNPAPGLEPLVQAPATLGLPPILLPSMLLEALLESLAGHARMHQDACDAQLRHLQRTPVRERCCHLPSLHA